MKAVVLAGGRGTRLAPYTTVLPKPLLPVDGRTVLEIIVERLHRSGFDDIVFSVGYLGHLIEAVFADGSSRGVAISYVTEEEPLGTAGPLRNVPDVDETFVAMNGDVLTDLDLSELVYAHRKSGYAMTIATRERIAKIDYGVLHTTDERELARVDGFQEKPEIPVVVSMGVYVLEPRALELVPEGRPFDIPDLVSALLEAGEAVGAHRYDGFWLDIGRHEDYERALELFGAASAPADTKAPLKLVQPESG